MSLVLVIDFVLRLLVIERKTAAAYADGDQENASQNDWRTEENASNTSSDSEARPLLEMPNQSEYKLHPSKSNLTLLVPILACLGDSRILIALFCTTMQAALDGSFDATVVIQAQELFNFDSAGSGLLLLPVAMVHIIMGPIAGWAVDRFGTKSTSTLGFLCLTPILFLLRIPHSGGADQLALFVSLLCLYGIALSVIGPPSMVEIGAVVDKYHKANPEFFGDSGPYAQVYGLNTMVYSGGFTIGPLVAGALKDKIGYGNMNAVFACVCLVTSGLMYIYMQGRLRYPSISIVE